MSKVRPFGPVSTTITTDQIDRLHDVINRRRDATKTVSVSVEDLTALLNDHAALCAVCNTTN